MAAIPFGRGSVLPETSIRAESAAGCDDGTVAHRRRVAGLVGVLTVVSACHAGTPDVVLVVTTVPTSTTTTTITTTTISTTTVPAPTTTVPVTVAAPTVPPTTAVPMPPAATVAGAALALQLVVTDLPAPNGL